MTAWQYHPLMILMQLGGLVSLGVAAYAVRHMRRNGRNYLVGSVALLAFNNAIFLFAATAKMASPTIAGSLFWYKFEYFGYTANPGVGVILALAYTNREQWLTPRRVAAFSVIPIVLLVAVFWNPNDLMITDPSFVQVGRFRAFEHEITFGHGLQNVWGFGAFGAAIIIVAHGIFSDRVPRTQGTLVALTFLLPIVIAGLKASGVYPPGGTGINVTPAVGGISLTLVAIAILRYRLFELPPVGRQRAIDVMQEGYVLVNDDGEIADSNPAARRLLTGDAGADVNTQPVSGYVPVADALDDTETDTFTVSDTVIQVTCSEIWNNAEYEGRVLLLFDITERREREQELERKERIIENLPVGVFRTTPGPRGDPLYMNQTLAEMFGAESKAELSEYAVSDMYVNPAEREQFSEKLLNAGEISTEEIRVETLDGEQWWALISNTRVERDGEVYFEGTVQDITERKEREQQLERARQQIQSERDGKEAIRQLLLQTATDRELAETVCRILVESYGYTSVWLVKAYEGQDAGSNVVSMAEYGDDRGFRDTEDGIDPVTERAFRSGTPVTVAADADTETARLLDDRGLQNIRSIPLAHDGITYGALTVLRDEPETQFGRELVNEFGDAIAFKGSINRQQAALVADTVIELNIRITDGHFLAALTASAEIPADVTLTAHEISDGEEVTTIFVRSDAVDAETIETAAAQCDEVRETAVLGEENGISSVEVGVRPPTVGSVLGSHGGVVDSITATDGRVEVTVQFPRRTDVSKVVDAVRQHWPEAAMQSRNKRQVEGERPAVFGSLTEKQEEALRAAALAGFFDRPQQATADEVADSLGVSRSTFLTHIRRAEKKIFADEAFDAESVE